MSVLIIRAPLFRVYLRALYELRSVFLASQNDMDALNTDSSLGRYSRPYMDPYVHPYCLAIHNIDGGPLHGRVMAATGSAAPPLGVRLQA